jgi:hypothetical protein
MNRLENCFLCRALLVVAALLLLTGCLFKIGDTDAVKQADELLIACKHDEALAASARASQAGGLGAGLADLQRVYILRDAGRMAEADAAMKERNARWKADPQNVADAEAGVAKSLEALHAERLKRTGKATCD